MCRHRLGREIGGTARQAGPSNGGPPMSRPLREAHDLPRDRLLIAIGIAVAMPHCRHQRPAQCARAGHGGADHHVRFARPAANAGSCGAASASSARARALWPFALARPDAPGRQRLRCGARARTWPTCGRSTSRTIGVGVLDAEPRRLGGVHDGPLPGRGDRLARLPPAAGPAAHQPAPSRSRHRVHPRLLPPAADPDRDDVRRVRQPLDRGTRGGARRSPWAASSTPTCGTGPAASGRCRWPTVP